MLVDFSLPLPSANRLAKAILGSEESRNEKTLYFAEHHWYTVDYSQFVQESLLDVIEAQEKMFLAGSPIQGKKSLGLSEQEPQRRNVENRDHFLAIELIRSA